MSNPAAYFDVLLLGERISDLVEGFSKPEIHLFSYAACLLSLYEGAPVADWEYEFVSGKNGLPFSAEIDDAMDALFSLGFLERRGPLISVTDDGRTELVMLGGLTSNKERQ